MKSLNLFSRLFTTVVLITMVSLVLSFYAGRKAYDADPALWSKIEDKLHISFHSGGSFVGFNLEGESTKDSWRLPLTQKMIHIKSFNGRIAIKPTASNEIAISASGKLDTDESPKLLEVNSTDDELTLTEPKEAVRNLEIHIEIPNSYSQGLRIDTVSGDISLENLSLDGLILGTVSGGIVFDSIKAESLTINSISGDTQIRNSSITKLNGSSASGRIAIENQGGATTRLQSSSGDIDLQLPKSEQFHFQLNTISGDIKNNHIDESKAMATIEVSTTSGDIDIE